MLQAVSKASHTHSRLTLLFSVRNTKLEHYVMLSPAKSIQYD
jgi:hypothetical protein